MKNTFHNKAAFSRTLPCSTEVEYTLKHHCPEIPGVHWSAAARQTQDAPQKSDFKLFKNKKTSTA